MVSLLDFISQFCIICTLFLSLLFYFLHYDCFLLHFRNGSELHTEIEQQQRHNNRKQFKEKQKHRFCGTKVSVKWVQFSQIKWPEKNTHTTNEQNGYIQNAAKQTKANSLQVRLQRTNKQTEKNWSRVQWKGRQQKKHNVKWIRCVRVHICFKIGWNCCVLVAVVVVSYWFVFYCCDRTYIIRCVLTRKTYSNATGSSLAGKI